MSILGLFLLGSFAALIGLGVALAFARAVLYANVCHELDESVRILPRADRVRTKRGGAPRARERVEPLAASRSAHWITK